MIESGKKVRVVLQRVSPNDPQTIFRGDVLHSSDSTLVINGRRFAKVIDTASNRAEEKPLDGKEKTYMIPATAMRFAEVIIDGSPEDELDKKIRSEPLIKRKGTFALVD